MAPSSKLPKLFDGMFPVGSFWSNVLNVYAVAYLVFILAAVCWFVFYKTRFGAHLRAVGEHPEACESLGIDVYKVRYTCVILSGFLAGTGRRLRDTGHHQPVPSQRYRRTGLHRHRSRDLRKVFTRRSATKACLLFGLCSGIKSLAGQQQHGFPEPDFHDPVCGDHSGTGAVRRKSTYTGG